MRLLFFVSSLAGGGAERVTASLCNHWAAKGWNVCIVTLKPITADAYTLDPRVKRRSLGIYGASQSNFDAIYQNLKIIRCLRAVIREEMPDIAVGMMAESAALLAISSIAMSTVQTVGAVRSDPKRHRRSWKFVQSQSFGLLSSLVVQTGEVAKWAGENTNAGRIDIIPNPIEWPLPHSSGYVNPGEFCNDGRSLLLAAGRLTPEKGFDRLIEAFSKIAVDHKNWDLAIIGAGALERELRVLATAKGVAERVLFPGWVGNLTDWYQRADVFVVSSRTEGFPNALLEAMAHGLAVVSFDCDYGPRDLVRNGENGLLVPPGDIEGLAGALRLIMRAPELRDQFGRAAVLCRRQYSIEDIADKWESMFADLLRVTKSKDRIAHPQ